MLMTNRCIGTVARMGGCPAYLAEFMDSFADLVAWNAGYLCGPGEYVHYPRPPRVSIHDVARNSLVDTMRGDWLLQLDSDHAFEPDLCARLMNVAEKTEADVVVGMYQYRQPPYSPVLYVRRGDGMPMPLMDWESSLEALEVYSSGAGCLWARRSVFDRVKVELNEKPFDRVGGMGEDHSFFLRLAKLKIKVVAALNVECHHLEVRPLTLADYERDTLEIAPGEPARGYK